MNLAAVQNIADAVLYEGYLLYPYRPGAVKNRHRWTFGVVAPRSSSLAQDGAEAWAMQTECLVVGGAQAALHVLVRFLHLGGGPPQYDATEQAVTVDVALSEILKRPRRVSFSLPPSHEHAVEGVVELRAEDADSGVVKVTVRVENLTPFAGADREETLSRSLVSTHMILGVQDGEFISLIDPPEAFRDVAARCRNVGVWPVLAGDEGQRQLLLAAPIILYDYPRIAPESPGNLYDGTEIDEILTLRILTLTDEEKREARSTDARTRALLDRSEALGPEQLLKLHGAMRTPPVRPGDHVRLRPRASADAFDLLLAGKTATVVKLEQDYEGRVHVAVTLNDDPGRDLGEQGLPGHRFFFRADEVEPLMDEIRNPKHEIRNKSE